MDYKISEILPHIGICEWGAADTELIMRDLMRAPAAISVMPEALGVLNALAPESMQIFGFTNDRAFAPGGRAAMQLFTALDQLDGLSVPGNTVLAFDLADIQHLDWNKILRKKSAAAGFMFLDNAGANIHKLFAFLNLIGGEYDGALHYCGKTNDPVRLWEVLKLVERVRPNLLPKFLMFATYGFFANLDIQGKQI